MRVKVKVKRYERTPCLKSHTLCPISVNYFSILTYQQQKTSFPYRILWVKCFDQRITSTRILVANSSICPQAPLHYFLSPLNFISILLISQNTPFQKVFPNSISQALKALTHPPFKVSHNHIQIQKINRKKHQ